MKKQPIGILDMGLEGFSTLDSLSSYLKYEDLLYVHDMEHAPYEGKEEKHIQRLIAEKVKVLLDEDCKMIVVVSDCIVEYAMEYLKSLPIPVFTIVDVLIDYINLYYDQKNMILLAKNSIIEANLYQKNFRYNHLYNIPSDVLEAIVFEDEIKTSKSFAKTKEAIRSTLKKEVDIIICSSPCLTLLKTELLEYLPYAEILDPGAILAMMVSKQDGLYQKKRGKVYVYSTLSKKELQKRLPWYFGVYKVRPFRTVVKVENQVQA